MGTNLLLRRLSHKCLQVCGLVSVKRKEIKGSRENDADKFISSRNGGRSTDWSTETLCGEVENCRLCESDLITASKVKTYCAIEEAGTIALGCISCVVALIQHPCWSIHSNASGTSQKLGRTSDPTRGK